MEIQRGGSRLADGMKRRQLPCFAHQVFLVLKYRGDGIGLYLTQVCFGHQHSGKPAIMRAHCWCFALCEDSGVQRNERMLFLVIFES